MGMFFQINWLVIVVTLLILVGGYFGEKKYQIVSKRLKVEPKSFYVIILFIGIIITLVNFIAMRFFGSWKAMIIAVVAAVAIGYAALYFLRRKK